MSPTLLALWLSIAAPIPSPAHTSGEDYVFFKFQESSIEGHFEVHVDDLQEKLGLEIDSDEEQALEDVIATAPDVIAYIEKNFSIGPEGGAPYTLAFDGQAVQSLPKGTFAQYYFTVDSGPLPDRLDIEHSMFYEDDKMHRGLVLVEYNAKTDTTYPGEFTSMVFSPTNREQTLDLTDIPTIIGPREMIAQGVWHIWIGIDHILFLLALMLPTVLTREKPRGPVPSFKTAFVNILKIVTVFTIAHSVTLVLGALDLVSISSRVVESVIALSIILVALNNIFPKVRDGALWVILVLGLFHGLGFASVMGHLPFRMGDLLKIVIGFNIGVELGQVAIVAAVFPVLYLLRKSPLYQPVFLKGLSGVLILVAGYWFVQRAFGLE